MDIKIIDSPVKQYKQLNGTCYNVETSDEMVKLLEFLRANKTRVRFHWGNTETGHDWNDDLDVAGTIGRSTGTYKIPILIHNRRSLGGGAILTDCIVKIEYANKKDGGVIYEHPNYKEANK